MHPLLKVNNLSVTFRLKKQVYRAVRDISFELGEGEILGLVGESGSGKSATAKALVQLLPPHSSKIQGSVLYKDRNLLSLSESEIRKVRGKEISMIFQDPMTSLNPTMRVGQQIIEAILHHLPQVSKKEAVERALELLELVGISQPQQRLEAYPHTLSGGMRQRVMIALALSAQPRLIIADEPTTALDVTIQAQILELLQTIKDKTGTSFLLITHDLSIVAGFCDRVHVMYAGKIVEKASVFSLFKQPSHPYTKGLLEALPRLDMPSSHPLTPIEGAPPNPQRLPEGCAFCPRCPYAMRICLDQDPTLFAVDESHESACWMLQTATLES